MTGILKHAKWIIEEIGGWIVRGIHYCQYMRNNQSVDVYGVGECCAGVTNILYVDDLFYAIERTGAGSQTGLVLALNNSEGTLRQWVLTRFENTTLTPKAWRAQGALCTRSRERLGVTASARSRRRSAGMWCMGCKRRECC